jgi:nitrite reductase/ring-hydroxylating ferredoxin subunit/uncharacterized membrane protein
MPIENLTDLALQQEWTTPIEEGLQKAIASAYAAGGPAGQKVENALHGTWLGHPLHPVLTDIPIGAWTVAVALDAADSISGSRTYARGADAAVAVGLIGAVGAAVTGLTDWHKTDGKARKIGLAHGLLNISATTLFAASWILRKQKQRETAKLCSLAGYIIAGASAYLGGSLVYKERIGTDHAQREKAPDHFVSVLADADLPEGQMKRVEVEGIKVLLVRRNGRVYALGEICAHLGGPLSEGTLEDNSVRCPWHGSRFALESGDVLDGPATYPQPCFEARIREGQIEVRWAHSPPALTDAGG